MGYSTPSAALSVGLGLYSRFKLAFFLILAKLLLCSLALSGDGERVSKPCFFLLSAICKVARSENYPW